MRTKLTLNDIDILKKRFGGFHDAVIHSIYFCPFTANTKVKPLKARIVVGVRDWEVKTHEHWINVVFDVEEVTRFILKKPENFGCSVISRFNIGFFNNSIYLDFFPGSDRKADVIESYDDSRTGKGSMLIVAGKKCFWSEAPYEEHGLDEQETETNGNT